MRKLAAIMFTDVVGYSAMMSEDESSALQVLEKNPGDIPKMHLAGSMGSSLKRSVMGPYPFSKVRGMQ